MADIAIAHIEDAFDSDVYGSQASFELSQKKEIDRYDKNILLTPEPNNKIFRRRVIIQNGISFDNTENAEDADFLLDFLDAADRITGCDDLVYRRNHRSKAGQASATSLISRGNLERIKEMNVNLAARLDARIQTEEDRLAESAGRDSMEFREEQMKHAIATSKVLVLDSYCIAASILHHRKSLKIIQMWHAMGGYKKFGKSILDMEEGSSAKLADVMVM